VRPRLARADDLPHIEALVEAAYAEYVTRIGMRPIPMDDDYAARVERSEAWVLGNVDALIVLVPGEEWLLVDNVAVRPDLQGRGLGRRLLAFAEHETARHGYRELRLYTNEKMTENRDLYARLGYEEIGRESITGRHAVWMRKLLS
jgi:GNAT superfamily N-acetyltransferase